MCGIVKGIPTVEYVLSQLFFQNNLLAGDIQYIDEN